MIALLKGVVESINQEVLVVDVQGVGYEVYASTQVLEAAHVGKPIRLIVFTDVKENSISLYGFSGELDRQVFLLLRKVKGIGAKTAMAVLSALSPEGVLSSIGREDMSALRRVPGVGQKTAERVIVELREAVREQAFSHDAGDLSIVASKASKNKSRLQVERSNFSSAQTAEADVVLALERLGFPSERARDVVLLAIQDAGEDGLGRPHDSAELLRRALANLQ